MKKYKRFFFAALMIIIAGSCVVSFFSLRQSNESLPPAISTEEWLWLNQNYSSLTVTQEREFAPFSYLNPKGHWTGLTQDYLELIEKRLGFSFIHDQYGTQFQPATRQPKKPATIRIVYQLPSALPTKELVTTSYVSVPHGVFINTNHRRRETYVLQNMEGLRIAVVINSCIHNYLKKYYPNLTLIPTDSELTALLTLSNGRCDAALINEATAFNKIDEFNLSGIRNVGTAGPAMRLAFKIQGNHPELRSILQKMLDSFPEELHEKLAARWLNKGRLATATLKKLKKNFTFFLILATIATLLFFMWVTILRRQINIKTAELQHELTLRKNIEKQLLQGEKINNVGTLACGFVHDLNNLLTAILGYAELSNASKTNSNEQLHHNLDQIHQAACQAQEMAKNILSHSKNNGKAAPLRPAYETISDSILFLKGLLPPKISIQTQLTSHHCGIRTTTSQISQLLLNLCWNACDAMRGQGTIFIATELVVIQDDELPPYGTLYMLGGTAGEYLRISVRDTGTGIPENKLKQIFTPFYTTKSPVKGTGIGLFTVKEQMKKLRGNLRVETSSYGATFHLLIPVTELNAANIPQNAMQGTTKSAPAPLSNDKLDSESAPTEKSAEKQLSILIISADTQTSTSARKIYQRLGHVSQHASTTDTALELVKTTCKPSLIILHDKISGQLSLTELTNRIYNIDKEIPIVFCTAPDNNDLTSLKAFKNIKSIIQHPLTLRDYVKITSLARHERNIKE